MLSRMNKDEKINTIRIISYLSPLLGQTVMLSHRLNHWLQVAVMTALMSGPMPKDVTSDGNSNESGSNQILTVRNIMAAVHSHDSEGPMGWIGKGFKTHLKALTGVLSKEEGQVT